MLNIGQKIKDRRKNLGFTLEEVAQKVGVTKATIQRWESGQIKVIGSDKIEKLANAINVDISTLISKEKAPEILSSIETIAAHRTDDLMDDLPEEALKSIEEYKAFVRNKYKKD